MKELFDGVKYFFSIDNNTAATILITVGVFLIGIILNSFWNLIRSAVIDSENKSNIKSICREIGASAYIQYNNFEQYERTCNIDQLGHILKSESISHIYVFNEYSYNTVKGAFVSKLLLWRRIDQIKKVNNIYKHINHLLTLEESYKREFSEINLVVNRYENEWGLNMEGFRRLYDELRIKLKFYKFDMNDPFEASIFHFLNEVGSIWNKWSAQKNKTDFTVQKSLLVDPLINFLRRTDFKQQPRINGVDLDVFQLKSFELLLGAYGAFVNLKYRIESIKESSKSYANGYRRISAFLLSI